MRFTFSAKTALIGCAVALAACAPASSPTNTTNTAANTTANKANSPVAPNAPAVPTAPAAAGQHNNSSVPHPEINRISVSDAQALVVKNEAVVVDVRGADAYATSHIKGALHIPSNETQARMKELPRDKRIITYCSWPAENSSASSAAQMKQAGLTNVETLKGGFAAWQQAGLPVETGKGK